MSHAHRKVAWVKRQGAAVHQRRVTAELRRIERIRTVDLATLTPFYDDLAEVFRSIDDNLRDLPYATFSGQISDETMRKIAAMFPLEGERP